MNNAEHAPQPVEGRILVVESDSMHRFMLSQVCQFLGAEVEAAENAAEAFEKLAAAPIDLIFLDLHLADMDGMAVLKRITEHDTWRMIPLIAVCSPDETRLALKLLEAGAEDYVTWPIEPGLLSARLRASLERRRLRHFEAQHEREYLKLKSELAATSQELRLANLRLEEAVTVDNLTGLPNRRFAMETLHQMWAASSRTMQPLSVLMVDIDRFKEINNQHGVEVGDAVLHQAGAVLRDSIRDSDVLCRFAGEQFIVFCPDTDLEAATVCGERLRQAVASGDIRPHGPGGMKLDLTVSVGAAQRNLAMAKVSNLLKAADDALRAAKEEGRDRVASAMTVQ